MSNEKRVGDIGYGVEGNQPEPDKPKITSKGPDWNSYFHPDRWKKKLGGKPKPSEFANEKNKGGRPKGKVEDDPQA